MRVIAYWDVEEYNKIESLLDSNGYVSQLKLHDDKRKYIPTDKQKEFLLNIVKEQNVGANLCTISYTTSRMFDIKFYKIDKDILEEYNK